jgi:hypothetical protein
VACGLKPFDGITLLLWENFGYYLVYSELPRYRLGRDRAVSREHHCQQASLMKEPDGLRRGLLNRFRNSNQPGGALLNRNKHRDLTLAAKFLGEGKKRLDIDGEFLKEARVSDGNALSGYRENVPIRGRSAERGFPRGA